MTELHLEYRRNTGNPVPDFDKGAEQDYIEWLEELAEKQREFDVWVESMSAKIKKMKRTKHNRGTILTNDPSITAWGYVVLTWEGEILKAGCIKTKPSDKKLRIRKGDDTTRRIHEINSVLLPIIKKYNVVYMLSELPHGSQSAVAAKMIGVVTAIGQTISDCKNIGMEWYSEGDAKMSVLEKRSATKQEMINAIDDLYDVNWTTIGYIDEAIADALAVYHVAQQQSSALKLLKQQQ